MLLILLQNDAGTKYFRQEMVFSSLVILSDVVKNMRLLYFPYLAVFFSLLLFLYLVLSTRFAICLNTPPSCAENIVIRALQKLYMLR